MVSARRGLCHRVACFGPGPIEDKAEAPVVFSKVGEGFLGYTGDVNAEEETTVVVLAMLGLL